jgi:hypothetical protein
MRFPVAAMLACLVLAETSAFAGSAVDYTVAESNVSALHPGAKLAGSTHIILPDGGEITLADSKGGQTVCRGPYKGAVSGCSGPPDCSLVGKALVGCGSGGDTAGGSRTPGGTRDLKQP